LKWISPYTIHPYNGSYTFYVSCTALPSVVTVCCLHSTLKASGSFNYVTKWLQYFNDQLIDDCSFGLLSRCTLMDVYSGNSVISLLHAMYLTKTAFITLLWKFHKE